MSEHIKILKTIESGAISPSKGAEHLQKIALAQESPRPRSAILDALEQLERGELNAEQAVQLLSSKSTAESNQEGIVDKQQSHTPPNISGEELRRWQQWWTVPLYIGTGIVALSTFWINAAYQNSGYGFWFFCAWLPLMLGVFIMALSWRSRSGPWIHLRVSGPNQRVAISVPAPLGLAGWALRTYGHHIPRLDRTSVDEILMVLEQTSKNNAQLYVYVNEDAEGEQVEVFIG